jgi:DNA topoisomerase-1
VRNGRFGPYVQLGDDPPPSSGRGAKKVAKPRRASLFKDMDVATVTLADALDLLCLPRTVGVAPDGEAVVAANGRFGPFLSKGTENRSLETERQLLTITLDEALEILARPKERRRGVAKPPLADLGPDPVSGRPLVVKEGRFGAYVTDGETNASLRVGDRPEELTVERALELLDERRARIAAGGGAKKPAARRSTTAKKPAAAKKPGAAKKPAAARKPAAKKPAAARKRPTT